MATGVGRGRICLTSFHSPPTNTSYTRRKRHCEIFYTSGVIACFVSNFVAMATGFGSDRICLLSFNSTTPKTPVRRQRVRDISCTSRVTADFVSSFVAMATGVGLGRICLASFNSPTPKTPCYTQRSPGYLLYKPIYSRFCPKFRCHGNGGWSW